MVLLKRKWQNQWENRVRLLQIVYGCSSCQKSVVDFLKNGDISAGHARALLSLKDEQIMLQLAKKVTREELSVRELELLVKSQNEQHQEKEKKPSKPKVKYFQEVELALHDHLGRKVSVEGTKNVVCFKLSFMEKKIYLN